MNFQLYTHFEIILYNIIWGTTFYREGHLILDSSDACRNGKSCNIVTTSPFMTLIQVPKYVVI